MININSFKYKTSLFLERTRNTRAAIKRVLGLTVYFIYLIWLLMFPNNVCQVSSLMICCAAFFVGENVLRKSSFPWLLLLDMFFHEQILDLGTNMISSLMIIFTIFLTIDIMKEISSHTVFWQERSFAKIMSVFAMMFVWISGPDKLIFAAALLFAVIVPCFLCGATNWLQVLSNQKEINLAIKTAERLSDEEICELLEIKSKEAALRNCLFVTYRLYKTTENH